MYRERRERRERERENHMPWYTSMNVYKLLFKVNSQRFQSDHCPGNRETNTAFHLLSEVWGWDGRNPLDLRHFRPASRPENHPDVGAIWFMAMNRKVIWGKPLGSWLGSWSPTLGPSLKPPGYSGSVASRPGMWGNSKTATLPRWGRAFASWSIPEFTAAIYVALICPHLISETQVKLHHAEDPFEKMLRRLATPTGVNTEYGFLVADCWLLSVIVRRNGLGFQGRFWMNALLEVFRAGIMQDLWMSKMFLFSASTALRLCNLLPVIHPGHMRWADQVPTTPCWRACQRVPSLAVCKIILEHLPLHWRWFVAHSRGNSSRWGLWSSAPAQCSRSGSPGRGVFHREIQGPTVEQSQHNWWVAGGNRLRRLRVMQKFQQSMEKPMGWGKSLVRLWCAVQREKLLLI